MARLIAGQSGYICNECVVLSLSALDEIRPETPFLDESTGGRLIHTAKDHILVRLADGCVYACVQATRWAPLEHGAETFEWCYGESVTHSTTALVVLCVRRSGRNAVLGETYASDAKPGAEHARTIAARFPPGDSELEPPMITLRATECWIADEPVAFLHPSGRREIGRIAIGLPVVVSDGEAQCRIALEGLEKHNLPISGASSLQALLLATRFLAKRLHAFRAGGGRVVHRDRDEDIALEASFGPLLVD